MNHNPYNNYMKKYLLSFLIISSGAIFAEDTVANIFKVNYKNQLFMDVEVALAEAQSELGIIPSWAANEISSKADIKYLSQKDIDMEHKLVRHTLVARLNVWKRSIDKDAAEYLHYGATTVDIWDTVLVLQIKDSIDLLIDDLLEIEDYLLTLTKDNLYTYMPGRTLGQHALPITFGKKTSTWLLKIEEILNAYNTFNQKLTNQESLKEL